MLCGPWKLVSKPGLGSIPFSNSITLFLSLSAKTYNQLHLCSERRRPELLAAAQKSQNLTGRAIKTPAELTSVCASDLIHMGNET